MLHYCSYTHHFGENMKVQFILDNGDIIETTVIELSRYLDSMAEAGLVRRDVRYLDLVMRFMIS